MRLKFVAMLALATVTAFGAAFSGPAPVAAADSASVNGCTVYTYAPGFVWIDGYKYAQTNVYVTCSVGRTGIVNGQIFEADPAPNPDDAVTPLRSNGFTIFAGQTQRVLTLRGACSNFDPTGSEELYTHAKINVGGINSGWANSLQVSATC